MQMAYAESVVNGAAEARGEARVRLSVLDLAPVPSGGTAAGALRDTLDLARLADGLGYTRYWLAEHHNTPLIACSAPEVLIGHVAGVTSRLRVGSGGVMLPNHAPLHVAEAFRTLEALHPGRIDLGLGRAPGTDPLTAFALRGARGSRGADDFPEQLADLLAYLTEGRHESRETVPGFRASVDITAVPDGVAPPEIYLLGSSDFSARLAAERGLGFAFAHHINPGPAVESLWLYHERFRPSPFLSAPRSLVAVSAVCADTDAEADVLARSADLAILRLHRGEMGPLPSVDEATAYPYTPPEREQVRQYREQRLFVGSPATLHDRLTTFARAAGVDEIMVTTLVHDHARRRHSYELLAQAFSLQQSAVRPSP
jgi:luciferase family oxidoreductase group 1